MGSLVPPVRVIVLLILLLIVAGCLSGCSSSNPVTTTTNYATPLKVALSPSSSTSLELGATLTFNAAAENASNTAITEPIAYESSDPSVLTISTGGLACAGSWNSLSSPSICTPGKVGVVQVIAVAQGISSPATTVYVHQHIDSVAIVVQPGQASPQSSSCFSKGQSYNYQATAYSRQGQPAPGLDITATVGPFTWQATNANVATIAASNPGSPVNGLLPGTATITANVPGTTPIIVTTDGVSSTPFNFNTCLVQSITLAPENGGGNQVSVASSSSTNIVATVTDTLNNVINGSFLSWCSSAPGSVGLGGTNCGTGINTNFPATTTASGGGAAVIATCTPPNCNIGVLPSLPIYPPNPITVLATGAPTTGTTSSVTIWVSTTGCAGVDGCVSGLAPITASTTSGASTFTAGSLLALPATPNSMVFNSAGTAAYLGTDTGEFGIHGLMVLAASGRTISQFPAVVGKVLAVSPDGGTVIVSDTLDTPNQVYVFNCSSTGATGSAASGGSCSVNNNVALSITGASAAAFSPDGLKAYIVAGSTLYVYSKVDALQEIPLTGQPTDLTFLANGAFAYIAGEQPSTVTVRKTCDNTVANSFPTLSAPTPVPQILPVTATPVFIRALPNSTVLALDPPGIALITAEPTDPFPPAVPAVNKTGTNVIGCAPPTPEVPSGLPAIQNITPASFVNLGQGNFVPNQLIISADGSTAFLLTQSSGSVLVFHIAAQTISSIGLTGNVLPLQASLAQNGNALYVGASDGTLHVLDTAGGADIQQITFPTQPANLLSGLCENVNFPTQSVVAITAAAQIGASTTYTYTLTSGPGLQVGRRITITGMANAGDNGAFTITALASGSFTVSNAIGVAASGQSGAGTVAFACNPDLVSVAP
jgi:trimeric autotransporter adhesin